MVNQEDDRNSVGVCNNTMTFDAQAAQAADMVKV
jgi:hypothetical protein